MVPTPWPQVMGSDEMDHRTRAAVVMWAMHQLRAVAAEAAAPVGERSSPLSPSTGAPARGSAGSMTPTQHSSALAGSGGFLPPGVRGPPEDLPFFPPSAQRLSSGAAPGGSALLARRAQQQHASRGHPPALSPGGGSAPEASSASASHAALPLNDLRVRVPSVTTASGTTFSTPGSAAQGNSPLVPPTATPKSATAGDRPLLPLPPAARSRSGSYTVGQAPLPGARQGAFGSLFKVFTGGASTPTQSRAGSNAAAAAATAAAAAGDGSGAGSHRDVLALQVSLTFQEALVVSL